MAEKTTDTRYIETVGRRKTSIARVRITPAARTRVTVNQKEAADYFKSETMRTTALEPFLKISIPATFEVTVRVVGGGISSQSEAVRHGISRALIEYDHSLRGVLKKEGFLKRDPRAKERRKFGLKKARKRKQWSKR